MSNRLRELRQAAGLAQQGLAVQAQVSPTLVASDERWGYKPTERLRERLARALGCRPSDIWPPTSEGVDVAAR